MSRAKAKAEKIRGKNRNQRPGDGKGFEGVRGNEYLNKKPDAATADDGTCSLLSDESRLQLQNP